MLTKQAADGPHGWVDHLPLLAQPLGCAAPHAPPVAALEARLSSLGKSAEPAYILMGRRAE
jgi:hypothetical protein